MTTIQTSKSRKRPAVNAAGLQRPPERRQIMSLRFSPTAWAKLIYFRDRGDTEIGGFGITPPDDLLYVQDFVTVPQTVGYASIVFDDAAVADFFDQQVDSGLKPAQFARIWLHTHPGSCNLPSATDEMTFQRVFGACQHAVMFILAKDGQSYARLRFNVGPGGNITLPVQTDYSRPFHASDMSAWEAEYMVNVGLDPLSAADLMGRIGTGRGGKTSKAGILEKTSRIITVDGVSDDFGSAMPQEWMEELQAMSPAERHAVMEELGQIDPWDNWQLGVGSYLDGLDGESSMKDYPTGRFA